MTIAESNAVNTVLKWIMGQPGPTGSQVTDEAATKAAQLLATKAYKALMAGLTPGDVRLDRQSAIRSLQAARAAAGHHRPSSRQTAGP